MTWCAWPGAAIGLPVLENYGCQLFDGLLLTLNFSLVAFCIGLTLTITCLYFQRNGGRTATFLIRGHVLIFRGSPLLCQLFFIYYGLGSFAAFWKGVSLWWFFKEPYYCAILALILNTTAYQIEILRGGLNSLSHSQEEAALSLGLGRFRVYNHVLLPQALLRALPGFGNEVIFLIKSSAVTSLITIYDLMGVTNMAFAETFDMRIYFIAAFLYILLAETVRRIVRWIELRLAPAFL